MIIYCVYAEKTEQIRITRNKPDFSVFSFPCRICYERNENHIRFAPELQCMRQEFSNCEEHWQVRCSHDLCDVFLSTFEEGFQEYHHYEKQEKITLGSSVTDDIYVQSLFLQERTFAFYFGEKVILAKQSGSLNSRPFQEHISFQNGDVFTYGNIRICFYEDFFLLNAVNNCFPNLKRKLPTEFRQPFQLPQRKTVLLPMFRIILPELTNLSFSLPTKPTESSYWSNTIPMLFMAVISLLSSVLELFERWQNGHMDNAVSVLLFPAAVVLGCFLYPLVRRKEQKRQIKRETNKAMQRMFQDSEQFLKKQEHTMKTQKEEAERAAPSLLELQEKLANNAVCVRNDTTLFFRLGTAQGVPFIFPLSKDRICYIDTEELFLHMVLGIALNFTPEQVSVSFLITPAFYRKHPWLGNLPHGYNHGSRQIAFSAEEWQEMEETFILFNWDQPVPKGFSGMIITNNRSCLVRASDIFFRDNGNYCFQSTRLWIKMNFSLNVIQSEQIWEDMFRLYQWESFPVKRSFSDPLFLNLYGVNHADELHIAERWEKNQARYSLTVPVGMKEDGSCIYLNLHENGQGPHGLIAGTTGSGKSEWIITLLLGIAVNYSPREVQMILIDFKGGGFINALHQNGTKLPHIIGEMTNLDENSMERVILALQRECNRREAFFARMTQLRKTAVPDLTVYQELWNAEMEVPYLPNLIITIDEFAEAKKSHPEFLQNLISIARIGRSLGIHMILATQKPIGIVDEQIWANIHFRICLKVASRQESREMIGNDKANHLKDPGEFYMFCDDTLQKGRCGYTGKITTKENTAVVYDPMLHIRQSIPSRKEDEFTQIQQILQQIQHIAFETPAPLWLEPLRKVSWKEIQEIPYCIGKTDDFRHNAQPPLCIDQPATAILAPRMAEKRRFFYTLCKALWMQNAVLCILDDAHLSDKIPLPEHPHVGAVMQSQETDAWQRLIKYLEQRSHLYPVFLIITDIAQVLNRYGEQYYQLLEQAENLHLHIIACGSTAASFSYRHLSLYPQRIVLGSIPAGEISSFLEQKAEPVQGDFACIVHTAAGQVHGIFARTTMEMLLDEQKQAKDQKKLFTLPMMPNMVSYREYHGTGWALGRRYSDCSYYEIPMDACIIVIAKQEEEMKSYYAFWKKYHSCPIWQPEDKEIRKILEDETGAIFFLDLNRFEKSTLRKALNNLTVLFIGKGYEQQHTFVSPVKHVKENEGLVFRNHSAELIRLVEKQ